MRIESLAYFLEIAQVGSFSAAARRLYVSQQGLSKSIKTLEREMDVTLFERSGKRVHLTDAGRDLVPLASACLADHRKIKDAMMRYSQAPHCAGGMRLMAMPFVANGLFNLLRDELALRELRNVVLAEKSLSDIMKEVGNPTSGFADVAMIVIPDRMIDCMLRGGDVIFIPLIKSQIMLLGTKSLISPRMRSISIEEAAKLPVAYFNEPILEVILEDMFKEHSLENVIMHSSNIQMLNEYIEAGQAVTFIDSFSAFCKPELGEALFIPIEEAASFSVGFVASKSVEISDATRTYVEAFKLCLKETCTAYFVKHPLG